jgi:AGZA family xanthine/uracil permease-like MFS transporter
LPIRQKIVDSIPPGLKINIGVSVGVFVATIGVKLANIVSFQKDGLPDLRAWHLASLWTGQAYVLYIGLLISLVLGFKRFKIPGGMLIAIIISAVICKTLAIGGRVPAHPLSSITSEIGQLHILSVLTNPHFFPVTLTFLIINFFGDVGKFLGLTAAAKTIQVRGKVPNMEKALYTDACGTVLGSLLGTSNLITYVESAVGIATGGRTGITAIVCGILMLASLPFTQPLVGFVPVEATAGVLVYVGWLLLPVEQYRENPGQFGNFDLAVAVAMGVISFVLFDLNIAMLVGFFFYTIREMFKHKRANVWLIATTLALAVAVALQHLVSVRPHP